MKKLVRTTVLLGAIGCASPVLADEAGGFSLGVAGGTLGFGAEMAYAVNPQLAIRLGAYGGSYGVDGEESGIEYDGDLDLSSVGAYVDWHPFSGAFRVTAGWFANDNELKGTGVPEDGDVFEIGDDTFTTEEVGQLNAKATFGNSAPYLGVGWNFFGTDGGFGLGLDLGVLFQDSPDITLTSTGGSFSDEPQLQQALADEAAQLEDDVDKYDLYPVASLSVSYRF